MESPPNLSKMNWARIETPRQIFFPRGLLGLEERKMLYFLTSSCWDGSGFVVDAGAYLGASAFCLAAGLAASNSPSSAFRKVYSYDLFVSDEKYVVNFVQEKFAPYADHNYRPIFDFQTSLFRDLIEARQGDFVASEPPPGPIQILFVDVAKTAALNGKIVSDYFPRLIPGLSYVVQQDYYHCWHPEIHVTMEYLREYFVIEASLVPSASRLYRLVAEIPPDEIARAAAFDFSFDQQMSLLDSSFARDSGPTQMMTRVAQILQCIRHGQGSLAKTYINQLTSMDSFSPDAEYSRQLQRVREMAKL